MNPERQPQNYNTPELSMDQRIRNYLQALTTLHNVPSQPAESLVTALPTGHLPMPQVSWTLAALMHYRRRVMWGRAVCKTVLRATTCNRVSDPWCIDGGCVPGMTEWTFFLLAPGNTLLTNRVTGERVLCEEGTPDNLIPNHTDLRGLFGWNSDVPAYQRLGELFPNYEAARIAIERLLQDGAILCVFDDIELSTLITRHQASFDTLACLWNAASNRLSLAVAIGDWIAAHRAAIEVGDARLIDMTEARAHECQQEWSHYLKDMASHERHRMTSCRTISFVHSSTTRIQKAICRPYSLTGS